MKTNTNPKTLSTLVAVISIASASTSFAAISYSNSWNTGNTWFGAGASVSAYDTTSPSNYTLTGSGNADAYVLTKKISLIRGNGSVTQDSAGNGRAQCRVVVMGSTLVNRDQAFRSGSSFDTTPITRQFAGGSITFSALGIPITVSGSANAQVWAHGSAVALANGTLDAKIAPSFKIAGYASAGINLGIGSAGVRGSLIILEQEAVADVAFTALPSPMVTSSFLRDHTDIAGAIDLYAKIGWGWFSKTWTKNLVNFSSPHRSTRLASSSYMFVR